MYILEIRFTVNIDIFQMDEIKIMHDSAIFKCKKLWESLLDSKNFEITKTIIGVELCKPIYTISSSFFNAVADIVLHKNQITVLMVQLQLIYYFSGEKWVYLEELSSVFDPIIGAMSRLNKTDFYYAHVILILYIIEKKCMTLRRNRIHI